MRHTLHTKSNTPRKCQTCTLSNAQEHSGKYELKGVSFSMMVQPETMKGWSCHFTARKLPGEKGSIIFDSSYGVPHIDLSSV